MLKKMLIYLNLIETFVDCNFNFSPCGNSGLFFFMVLFFYTALALLLLLFAALVFENLLPKTAHAFLTFPHSGFRSCPATFFG